jgi:hypothetical protein
MNCIDKTKDRDQLRALVNAVMNLPVSQSTGIFMSSCTIGGFSRRVEPHAGSLYECK